MKPELHRYPRTPHLEGSAVPSTDEDLERMPFEELKGVPVVVSEKIDGANAALSFTDDGRLLLQSRSRFLDDVILEGRAGAGPYVGFYEWACEHEDALWPVLRSRYVMFGEWVLAKQTVFYDNLPNAFLELDVYDKTTDAWLATPQRRWLLRTLPIVSAPTLSEYAFSSVDELLRVIGPSRFKTPMWRDELLSAIAEADGVDCERAVEETDPTDLMEGLVIKREENGVVVARAKLVRHGLRQRGMNTSALWSSSRRVKNRVCA